MWDGACPLNLLIADCLNPDAYKQLNMSRLHLAVSSLPLSELYNQVFRNMELYRNWEIQLKGVPIRDNSLSNLLATAVKALDYQASFYVLSPTFHLIDSCTVNMAIDRITNRLQDKQCLNDHQITFLLNRPEKENASSYATEPVLENGSLKGYLLIVNDYGTIIPTRFIHLLLSLISAHMSAASAFVPESCRELNALLTDIILFTPKDVDPLQQRLEKLPYPLQPSIRFLLVSQAATEDPAWNLFSELKTIFPNCNSTIYDGSVVILLSGNNFLFQPAFDTTALESTLKKYNAYAITSNAARFIRGLRIVYRQSKDMLSILPVVNINHGKRHAYFDDIREYYRVHLCATYLKEYYNNKLVYLLHPLVLELMRYDDAHDSDLCEFAFSFAQNNGSIAKTAENTNLHRNTVYNKLNRIRELFGIDLNDSAIQRELLFSSQVVRCAQTEGHSNDRWIYYRESRYLASF